MWDISAVLSSLLLPTAGGAGAGMEPKGQCLILGVVILTCHQQPQAHWGQGLAMSQDPPQTPLQLCPCFLAFTKYVRRKQQECNTAISLPCVS